MSCKDVYCGVWTNWAEGKACGSTLTLSQSSGGILIAFLALFVRFTGSHLWSIVCYATHQLRSRSTEQDDVYHHTQVLLRNSAGEARFLGDLGWLLWSRRRGSDLKRSLPLLLVALFHMLTLGAAGILSSKFILKGGEVLIRGSACGWLEGSSTIANPSSDPTGFVEAGSTLQMSARSSYQHSLIYSRICYADDETSPSCRKYAVPRIESSINTEAKCPFKTKICDRPAIKLDSGLIRSDDHLGINSKPQDKISYRNILTCAPLQVEDFTARNVPFAQAKVPGDTLTEYNFGPAKYNSTRQYDATMSVSNISTYYATNAYDLWRVSFLLKNITSSTFQPIPEFFVNDSDIHIIGLRNSAAYDSPIEDPWFNATKVISGAEPVRYESGEPLMFLGCVSQYQFCTSTDCSPLTGYYGITDEKSQNQNLTPAQLAIFSLVRKAVWATRLDISIDLVRQQILLANDYLWDFDLLSSALPSDQWQQEVINFHNISLALLQRRVTEYATPDIPLQPGVSAPKYLIPPATPELRSLCDVIKIRNTAYYNFSVLGLAMTLTVGLIIIVTECCLQWAVETAHRSSDSKFYRRLEWNGTSALQLQRLACEEHGIGPWVERNGVPRTKEEGKRFSVLGMVSKRDSSVQEELQEMLRDEAHEHEDADDMVFRYRVDRMGRPTD